MPTRVRTERTCCCGGTCDCPTVTGYTVTVSGLDALLNSCFASPNRPTENDLPALDGTYTPDTFTTCSAGVTTTFTYDLLTSQTFGVTFAYDDTGGARQGYQLDWSLNAAWQHFRPGGTVYTAVGSGSDYVDCTADPVPTGCDCCSEKVFALSVSITTTGTGGGTCTGTVTFTVTPTCSGEMMARVSSATAVTSPAAPVCSFRSADPLPAGTVADATGRAWYQCERPHFERFALPVSSCTGCGVPVGRRCGPICPGYVAAADEA